MLHGESDTGCTLPIFETVVVCGAGVMGHSLALLHALHTREVRLTDDCAVTLEAAFPLMEDALRTLHREGFCADPDAVLGRIRKVDSVFEALPGADLLVEAISEDSDIKRIFFASLLTPPVHGFALDAATLVVSNTSSLNVFELAPKALLPRLYVAHHFVPAHILPLVEVVPPPEADILITRKLLAHYRAVRAVPVLLKKYHPGFLVNRLQRAIHKEMFDLLRQEVVDAHELDMAVKASLGVRLPVLGIVKRLDFAGLALVRGNMTRLDPDCAPPQVLNERVEAGHLGIQTGQGFFDYEGRSVVDICRERDERMLRVRRTLENMGELPPGGSV